MLSLNAVTPEHLASCVPAITLAEARKMIAQVHRGEPVAPTSAIRKVAAEAVVAAGHVPQLALIEETPSAIDPFVKYLLASTDGARFEAVRIPLENPQRFTVCVGSQVGCALGCAFCATGKLGLTRNLHAWEIVEQVRVVRARLTTGRVHGVVFQGMGEPLANLDEVLDAIAVFSEPSALGIDARAITVCTAGLPHGIRKLAERAPNVRLGLSIHSALPEQRRSIMPIAKAHSLDDVLAACAESTTPTTTHVLSRIACARSRPRPASSRASRSSSTTRSVRATCSNPRRTKPASARRLACRTIGATPVVVM
jgi:23S rRNA (adenine2503-C2)-methyltransferase